MKILKWLQYRLQENNSIWRVYKHRQTSVAPSSGTEHIPTNPSLSPALLNWVRPWHHATLQTRWAAPDILRSLCDVMHTLSVTASRHTLPDMGAYGSKAQCRYCNANPWHSGIKQHPSTKTRSSIKLFLFLLLTRKKSDSRDRTWP